MILSKLRRDLRARQLTYFLGALLTFASGLGTSQATPPTGEANEMTLVRGQVLYVPVYSHIFTGTASGTFDLTTTLSLRNTDREHAITFSSVRYYDSAGTPVRAYLEEPRRLAPLASTEVVVEERDTAGGAGANFIVEWSADASVTAPVVEAVMISTASSQGLSFVSAARVLEQTP